MSEILSPQTAVKEKKVGIGAYLSLLFACIFFSGVLAGNNWWSVFDFTSLNGTLGKVVGSVSQTADGIHTAMTTLRGKGGSGAMDGFAFAVTLIPTVMFALAMVTVLEHYGALEAARKLLTPILRPLLGLPGSCGLALITSLQSTDGGAALTRQLKDAGEINEAETNIFCQFQYSADATITNFLSSGAVLFTLTAADGSLAVPTSIGVCLGLILVMKVVIANVMRLLMIRSAKKAA